MPWSRWSTKWNDNVENVRSECWPTAVFSRTKICESWKNAASQPMYPTRIWRVRLNTGKIARGVGRMKVSDPHLLRSRKRLRSASGRAWYKKRKGMVEPVIGTLKEQRGMRQFQSRGKS